MSWLRKRFGTVKPVSLGIDHLDTVTTPGPVYAQNTNSRATPERAYPVDLAGALEVLPFSPTSDDQIFQRYTAYQSLQVFLRYRYGGVWSEWKEL